MPSRRELIIAGIGVLTTIIASIVTFWLNDRERRPYFAEARPRTQILNSERAEEAPITVYREDGGEITADLTTVQFYIWNEGRRAIRPADVHRPIRLTLADPRADILDYRILTRSRPITEARLAQADTNAARSVTLDFHVLEHRDGIRGQITFLGPEDTPLKTSGIVADPGPRQVQEHRSGEEEETWWELGIAAAFLLGLSYGDRYLRASLRPVLDRANRAAAAMRASWGRWAQKSLEFLAGLIYIGVLLGLIIGVIWIGVQIADPVTVQIPATIQ